jgi:hypothetical protein
MSSSMVWHLYAFESLGSARQSQDDFGLKLSFILITKQNRFGQGECTNFSQTLHVSCQNAPMTILLTQ